MKNQTTEMVYTIVQRIGENVLIFGTGGFTRSSFKPIFFAHYQSAYTRYLEMIQSPLTSGEKITMAYITDIPVKRRLDYVDFLFRTCPACIAIPAEDLEQIIDEWIIFPTYLPKHVVKELEKSKKIAEEIHYEGKYFRKDIGFEFV